MKDVQRSTVEVDREGGYTKIELELHDRKETIRLPTSWLIETGVAREQDIHIVARRIDVDQVLVLFACPVR